MGETLPFAQVVAVGQDGANEGRVLVRQEGVEGGDGRQPAVDSAGLEALVGLIGDKAVDVAECDFAGWTVPGKGRELEQVVAVVAPRARRWIAAAEPVDKRLDFG